MNLPVLMPDVPDQRHACHGCGGCCRDPVVYLTGDDRRRIDEQGWAGRLGSAPYVEINRSIVISHAPGGACVFLDDAGRCRIHAEFGAAAKPLACRIYPFTFETMDDAHRVGLRFDCPSAARNAGAPLHAQRDDVGRWVRALADAGSTTGVPAELAPGVTMTPREEEAIRSHLDRWLKATGAPIVDRLCGLADLADTLAKAKLRAVRDERFGELLGLLIDELPSVTGSMRDNPPPAPTARQQRLLRQVAFAHAEHATFDDMLLPFFGRLAHRLDQYRRGRRMSAGAGSVPPLAGRRWDRAEFLAMDRAAPCSETARPAVDDLLTRYLRVRVQSGTVCGPGHLGYDLADGLRATLLTVVCAAWFARLSAVAAGRSAAEFEDWVTAIGIVDRTATRSPALRGVAARLRIGYLAAEQGVARLIRYWLGDGRGAA